MHLVAGLTDVVPAFILVNRSDKWKYMSCRLPCGAIITINVVIINFILITISFILSSGLVWFRMLFKVLFKNINQKESDYSDQSQQEQIEQ